MDTEHSMGLSGGLRNNEYTNVFIWKAARAYSATFQLANLVGWGLALVQE